MKKKFKKNRLKIFIALSLMFTLITTIFIGTKTFAYESSNEITDTLDINTLSVGNYTENTLIKEYTGTNNETYKCIEFNHNTTDSIYMSFGINLKSNLNYNSTSGNYTYLINFEYGYYDNNSNWNTYINNNSSSYMTVNLGNTVGTTNFQQQVRPNYYSTSDYGYNYKTGIKQIYQNNNSINYSNKLYFNFRLPTSTNSNSYAIKIYNIDIVPNDELYTQDYIDTYYGPIEEQYNQLLESYEQLEDDYFQLNNDYTELNQEYDELYDDYVILEDNYESITNSQLNQAFINSFNNAQIQVIDYLSGDGVVYTSTISNFNKPYYNLEIDTPDVYNFITNYINQGVRIKIKLTTAYNTPINIQFSTYGGEARLFKYINTVYNEPISGTDINNQGAYTLNTTNKTFDIIEIDEPFERQANVIISSTSLGEQYQKGYIDGLNTKDNDVYNLNNQIRNLTNQLQTQQQTINALNEQIEDFSSDYNLNNLMWTIAATPFESFKQIWNLNFMGVNLSNLFFGMISTLIGLYIVKKFFL